jgi:hypothetical protein
MSKGLLYYAHNNPEIDYLKLACVSSSMAQYNLGVENITVVTDSDSLNYTSKNINIDNYVSNVILTDKDLNFKLKNYRNYRDTNHSIKNLSFYNANRCDAYNISPYDQTIVLDVDYLIMSDSLNNCWDHNNELMLHHDVKDIQFKRDDSWKRVSDLGITMYWATVVYFQKTDYTESFFNIVKHVKENWSFYKELYTLPGTIYRNDFSFSVAAHVMNGFQSEAQHQLPIEKMYKTFDWDDIHKINGVNDITLFLEKIRTNADFHLCRWKDVDLHIMNKWALQRQADTLLEVYSV